MQKESKLYFGWYVVIVASIITLLTNGLRLGIGPFEKPIITDLAMSRTAFSSVVAIGMLVYGAGMPLAGALLRRFATKFVLLLGLTITCISIVWTVKATSYTGFFIAYGVLLSIGLSFLSPVAMTPIISKWFTEKRGQALFYMTTGAMAGIAIVTPLETILIQAFGWQTTLLLFGGLFVVLVVPAAFFIMKEAPETAEFDVRAIDDDKQSGLAKAPFKWTDAFKMRAYWQIIIGLFACGFSMNLLGTHAVPMLTDHGFTETTASFGVGLIGFTAIFSTLAMGAIADRYPRKYILGTIYVVRGAGFLGLIYAVTAWQLYLVAIIGGLVWAGSTATSSAILGDMYGARLVGILYGWAYFGHQIGGALGSFLGGWGYEAYGTHHLAFGLTTVLLVIAGVASYRLPVKLTMSVFYQRKEQYQHE